MSAHLRCGKEAENTLAVMKGKQNDGVKATEKNVNKRMDNVGIFAENKVSRSVLGEKKREGRNP